MALLLSVLLTIGALTGLVLLLLLLAQAGRDFHRAGLERVARGARSWHPEPPAE